MSPSGKVKAFVSQPRVLSEPLRLAAGAFWAGLGPWVQLLELILPVAFLDGGGCIHQMLHSPPLPNLTAGVFLRKTLVTSCPVTAISVERASEEIVETPQEVPV